MEELSQVVDTSAVEQVDGGNLPSVMDEAKVALDKFQVSQEFLDSRVKNGKLYGRFESFDDLFETAKKIEDKHANLVREIKNGKYQEVNVEAVKQATIEQTVQSLIPEFIANDMQLTAEIEAKAVEAGIDIRDLKLGAIEMREAFKQAYDIVGGKDEYDAMIGWGINNLTDKEKSDYETALKSPVMSKYAIKGLYADFKASGVEVVNNTSTQRLRGDSSSTGAVRPYANQAEILKDRAYITSYKGSSDANAKELYSRRMALTPDNVLYGR
jgi:hypothetical protein